jgi:hypothetical protein
MKRLILIAITALTLTACVPPVSTGPDQRACVKRSGEAILPCDANVVTR